jgi:hypothetical protein
MLTAIVTIAVGLGVLGLLLVVAVRGLRRLVRSFWPHS